MSTTGGLVAVLREGALQMQPVFIQPGKTFKERSIYITRTSIYITVSTPGFGWQSVCCWMDPC